MKKRIFIIVCCCWLFTLLLSGCRAERSEMNRDRNESGEVVDTVSKEPKPIPAESREHSVLSIDLAGTFTITNDFGETLIWDSSSDLGGSMKVYNTSIEPTGGDGPAPMYLEVPASDHFTLEPDFDNDLWFSVSDLNGYVRIAGSGIKMVYLSSAGTMRLVGDSMEFDAAYRPKDEQGKSAATSFNLHGTGEKEVYIRPSEDGLEAIGTTGTYTVDRVNDYGESIESISKAPTPLP